MGGSEEVGIAYHYLDLFFFPSPLPRQNTSGTPKLAGLDRYIARHAEDV